MVRGILIPIILIIQIAARSWRFLTHSAEPPRPIPWRTLFRLAFPLWLFTRLLALVVTYLSQTLLRAAVIQSPRRGPITLANMLNSWRLWDGGFYGRILREGYVRGDPIRAAFWPLYPLLSKPFEALLGATRWKVSLLLVSNLATLAALVLVGALAVQEDETLGAARRAMLLLAAAPLALFLIGAYSDSLFLALACAALFTARRGRWRAAFLWTFLAVPARPVGVALVAPLVWEYARQTRLAHLRGGPLAPPAPVSPLSTPWATLIAAPSNRWRHAVRRVAGVLALGLAAPLGVAVFSLACWRVYGDPLAWAHAERLFMHVTMAPWGSLTDAWRQFAQLPPASFEQARVLVDLAPLLLALVLTILTAALGWRLRLARLPVSFLLYLAGLLLICLVSPVVGSQFPEMFVSVGRYLLAAIPLYLVVGRLWQRWPWLETALLGGGFALQALLVACVLTGGWLV